MSGFYSIVQYSERPESGEFVNIGVVLFDGAGARLHSRFSEGTSRIKTLFGEAPTKGDFRFMVDGFTSRLSAEFGFSVSRESIEKFVKMRTGNVRMSPPRAIFITDVLSDLDRLFSDYVPDSCLR